MKRGLSVVGVGVVLGCGDAGNALDVVLAHSGVSGLNPYAASVGLVRVRVRADGEGELDATAVDVARDQRSARIAGYPSRRNVRIVAEGYDAHGNVVAYGERPAVSVQRAVSVTVALRRNLGYVTHAPRGGAEPPASKLYVFDLVSRNRVTTVRIPGTAPVARRISARGGASLLVSYVDGGQGFVGILDAATHGWRTIALGDPPDIALGAPGQPIGVAVGGGAVTFVDLDAASVAEVFGPRIGGRVLDGAVSADGSRAVVVIDVNPGLLLFDLEDRTVRSMDVINQPSGVGLAADGRTAYITSSADPLVVEVDLSSGEAELLGAFPGPVGEAAYSDASGCVFALASEGPFGVGRVLGFDTETRRAREVDRAVRTFDFPSGIAVDGSGRRLLVVATGGTTSTAGITLVDSAPALDGGAVGSSGDYPRDESDVRRYRPAGVAIVYGR